MITRNLLVIVVLFLLGSGPCLAGPRETLKITINGKTISINPEKPVPFEKICTDGEATFKALIAHCNVIFDIYADGCPPCKKMSPILDRAALNLPDNTIIVKINSASSVATYVTQQYKIKGVPTFLFFKKGAKSPNQRVTGCIEEDSFKDIIATHFGA